MAVDIFEHSVLCNKCDRKMKKIGVERSGFKMRALECPECGQRTYHPADAEEYNKFNELKGRDFKVKLRQVGNSYAVSIPKEFIDFFSEFEKSQNQISQMDQMVKLALEDFNRLSLSFMDNEENEGADEKHYEIEKNGMKTSVHEKSQMKHIQTKNSKGFISRKVKVVRTVKNARGQEREEEQEMEEQ